MALLGASAPLDAADPFFAEVPLVSFDPTAEQAAIDSEQEQIRQETLAIQEGLTDPVAAEKQTFKQQMASSLPFLAMIMTAKTQDQLNRAVMGYSTVQQQAQQMAERKATREQNRRMQAAELQLKPLTQRQAELATAERDIRSHDIVIKQGNQQVQARTNLHKADAVNTFKMAGNEFQRALSLQYTQSHLDTNRMLLLEGEKMKQFRERWDHEMTLFEAREGADKASAQVRREFEQEQQIAVLAYNSIVQRQAAEQQARLANPRMAHLIPRSSVAEEVGRVMGVARAVFGTSGKGELIQPAKTREQTIAKKTALEMTADDYTDPASAKQAGQRVSSYLQTATQTNPTDQFAAAEKMVDDVFGEAFQNPNLKLEHPDEADRAALAVQYTMRGLQEQFPEGVPKTLQDRLAFLQENASAPSFFESVGHAAANIGFPSPLGGMLPDSFMDSAVEFGFETGRGLEETGLGLRRELDGAAGAVSEMLNPRGQQFP
jgi:hypothetical protein